MIKNTILLKEVCSTQEFQTTKTPEKSTLISRKSLKWWLMILHVIHVSFDRKSHPHSQRRKRWRRMCEELIYHFMSLYWKMTYGSS
ncbi:hypothetical protein KC19_VG213100 [Ceratodon purpureus]|uniref:Uncharacterized protein n=1 Tax=Ceratodon purpureus TaxID=3225 RepID=A0A8T0HS52_CERPU|nr:hypothetical protein KC19_VG213100 [Ceratodon purpureus]